MAQPALVSVAELAMNKLPDHRGSQHTLRMTFPAPNAVVNFGHFEKLIPFGVNGSNRFPLD